MATHCCETGSKQSREAQRPKEIYRTSGWDSSKAFFESIVYEGKPCFLNVNQDGASAVFESLPAANGFTMKPKILTIPNFAFVFPSNYIVKSDLDEIFDAVYTIIDTYVNCSKEQKLIGSAFVLASYQQEKFDTFPYFAISGAPDCGKTVFGEIIALLCYYGWLAVSEHAANIYQFLHDISPAIGVIIEDEIQGLEKDLDKMKIYKSGYTNNTSVGRIVNLKPRVQEYFPTGCQKGLIGEYQLADTALKARTIEFQMFKGMPKGNWRNGLSAEDKLRLQGLHSSLLLWRLKCRGKPLEKIETGLTGRLAEVWNPLIWSCPASKQSEFIAIARSMYSNAEEENETEMEMRVVRTLQAFIQGKFDGQETVEISFSELCNAVQSDLGDSTAALMTLNKPHLILLAEYGELSKTQLGRIIKRRFKCHTKNKQNTWIYKFFKPEEVKQS